MRLVIAGGGFAGFWAAAAAARLRRDTPSLASLEILLISRDDQLVIRPRLYEPEPSRMAVPLVPRLQAIGVRFEPGEISSIDVAGASVGVSGKIRAPLRQADSGHRKSARAAGGSVGQAGFRYRHPGGRIGVGTASPGLSE